MRSLPTLSLSYSESEQRIPHIPSGSCHRNTIEDGEREREGGQAGGVWAELWHGGGMQRERPHNGRCSFHCYDPTHLYLKIPETVKALQSHRKSRQPALMGKQQHNSNWTPPIKHCRHTLCRSFWKHHMCASSMKRRQTFTVCFNFCIVLLSIFLFLYF